MESSTKFLEEERGHKRTSPYFFARSSLESRDCEIGFSSIRFCNVDRGYFDCADAEKEKAIRLGIKRNNLLEYLFGVPMVCPYDLLSFFVLGSNLSIFQSNFQCRELDSCLIRTCR